MNPQDIGKAYDQITDRWADNAFNRENGLAQHKRAIRFVKSRGNALDVGCGCTGRIIDLLLSEGFTPEGIDVSENMISLARQRHPHVLFHQQDISKWESSSKYDFISAWDSIWHIPLEQQREVLTRIIKSLNTDGVLIFSFGGIDKEASHVDDAMGPEVYYSSLGVNGFLQLMLDLGCSCRHLEYDQHPEIHAYLIVQKS